MLSRLIPWTVLILFGCQSKAEPHFEPAAETPAEMPTAADESPKPSALEQAAVPKAKAQPPVVRPGGPSGPDPAGGKFELAAATEGLKGKGPLAATIETSLGVLKCKLFDKKAPNTVANFVGLARGKRPFWDASKGAWLKRPLYDGTTFHRLIPGFMIQGGDHLGTGAGGVGYTIDDELHPSLKHDRAGLLCMANRGPNTNGGQFFVTDAAAPHLTAMKTYTIFGECGPTALISKIAQVPKTPGRSERPATDVVIKAIKITR